ncbi:RING-variant_domain_containing_protein [Leishmania braziliensis MHOM/BR/75/M2904]|uniref:RING-variant_domain_containing_protein n=1 Tax=Leishmania braziliensis MHOM/BR/75/M2904 TaxID=420245 RepID=A0A3P3ZD77_LEIBR|nr:unnamed protein product [Leishmania braziliensis]CAJ2478146.1 unnamed protein product [Leishmania braziliensis]SYZ68198.1 RING-variant_domain_containing_protein [Leishmania braziliensis MHOM/BR/75/M2904]
MAQDSSSVCRICQTGDAPVIRPCQCEGTMAYAHPYCLAEWIASRGELSCEVCGTAYTFQVAVEDVPPLASLRGLQLAGKLLVLRPLQRLCGVFFTPLQVLVCCLVVLLVSAGMWYSCLVYVVLHHRALTELAISTELFYIFGAAITIVPLAVLWAFEQFRVWVFLHEDYVSGLPPETPLQAPAIPALDDAATSALNEAFMRCSAESQSVARHRYVTVAEVQMNKRATLQLLKAKVRASRGLARQLNVWSFGPVRYAAKVLFVHMIAASAVVLGHVSLSNLKLLCHGAAALCSSLLPPVDPSLHLQAATAVTSATVPPYVYWVTAFVVGLMEWPHILRAAAWCQRVVDGRLSRPLFLCSLFTRSTALLLVLVLAWATVIPIVAYVCLFPFFVEGDLAVLMERREAWQVLRAEDLLPLHCNDAARDPASAAKPLIQPLNVARALFTVLPDVWRGECPPLFDTATCGLGVSQGSALPSPASLAEFLWYGAGVLMRISSFSTWLTLIGSMQTTLLWLLMGTFVMLSPYTLFAQDLAENEFFFAFLRLYGRGFWRTLLEVPLLVALYTATVGFGAFVSLHHLFPEAFPKSLTYLSLYSLEKQDIHFHFLYCWLSILRRLQTSVRGWLRSCFLYPTVTTPEGQQRRGQGVERAAYAACLVCANVLIGAMVEWASWSLWFPFLGFALSVLRVAHHGGNLNAAFPQLRRGVQNWKMQAVMLCFYGASVDFTRVETCMCRRLVRVKPSRVVRELLQGASGRNDRMLVQLLSSLSDFHSNGAVVCSRDTLRRLTTKTVQHVATLPRLSVAALLGVAVPLLVCSQWHLNYVDRIAADYIVLPLWFCLLLRWITGVLAVGTWALVEGLFLRTSLFRRCLEYAPQLIEGPPSLEAVHAVLLPLVIHSGLVRLTIAALTSLSDGSVLPTYEQLLVLSALLLLRLTHRPTQLHNASFDRLARLQMHRIIMQLLSGHAAPPAPPEPTGDAGEPAARDEEGGAQPPLQEQHMQPELQSPPVQEVAVAKPSRIAHLRARYARWVVSQTPSDVVLAAYTQSPFSQGGATGS